jgi:hypothetical protein
VPNYDSLPTAITPFSFQGLDAASQVAINAHVRQRQQFVAALVSATGSMTADATVILPFKPITLSVQEKPSVLDLAGLFREFSGLPYLQEFRWWLIIWLIYQLSALAINNGFQLEGEWHLKWFDGKIIITPLKK